MSDARRGIDDPFRILVLADFSGRASRGVAKSGRDVAARKLVRVDRDTLDDAMRAMHAEVRIAGAPPLAFASFDDLRPESIAARLPRAVELRHLRDRLFDARTAVDAAEEARALSVASPRPAPRAACAAPERAAASLPAEGEGLLGAILEAGPQEAAGGDEFSNIVREVSRAGVEKLRVARGPADRDELAARIDEEIASNVRGVLGDPGMRAFEASWRGVEFLVRRLDLGVDVRLMLLDVSRDEAFSDVGVSGAFDDSGLHRVIVEDTVDAEGAPRWTLVVSDWTFDATPRDAAALLRLAKLAGAAGASFVAGADPRVVGCRSLGETPDPEDWREAGDPAGRAVWTALRRLPEAAAAALVWPRILLRPPYGAKTCPVEGFAFEELVGAPDHERLPWGGGAFAVAAVLARAFESARWDFADAVDPQIDDLPAVIVDRGDGEELQPCAEVRLKTRGIERATSQGLLPLVSVAGAASIRLGNLNSLADPPRPLV